MAVYTDSLTSTAVTFGLLLAAPAVDGDSATDVRHIPGGNASFVDLGGQMLQTWEAEGRFGSYADFVTMLGLAGGQGVLAYTEDVPDISTAVTLNVVLKKVSRTKVTGKGTHFAKLSLVLLD